jgi:hypothetical protein
VLREASAILSPLLPAAEAATPPEVAPFATGLVTTPCRLTAAVLGPLITPGSYFLEILVDVQTWRFTMLFLPEAIRKVLSAPGLAFREVVLVEQSWPEM